METLVLSTGYEPLARVSWQRAINLLFLGKVEVVEEYEDRLVRSVTFAVKMPSVIRFLRAVRNRKRAIKFSTAPSGSAGRTPPTITSSPEPREATPPGKTS